MQQTDQTKILLRQEIEVIQNLDHYGIMKVYEVVEDSLYYYIICELLAEELA
jgi:sulfur relay (sulfurtransferase) DsrF/TusC family protein